MKITIEYEPDTENARAFQATKSLHDAGFAEVVKHAEVPKKADGITERAGRKTKGKSAPSPDAAAQ